MVLCEPQDGCRGAADVSGAKRERAAGSQIGQRLSVIGTHSHVYAEAAGRYEESLGSVGGPSEEEKDPGQFRSADRVPLLLGSEVGVIAGRMVGYVFHAHDFRNLLLQDSLDALAQCYGRHPAALAAPSHH